MKETKWNLGPLTSPFLSAASFALTGLVLPHDTRSAGDGSQSSLRTDKINDEKFSENAERNLEVSRRKKMFFAVRKILFQKSITTENVCFHPKMTK